MLNIPVLLPAFVDDCWTRSRLGGVDLRHVPPIQIVPYFMNVR